MNRTLRTAVVTTAAFAVALVAGAPAQAAERPLDKAKTAVTARIDKRLAALQRFDTALGKSARVQSAHRATLAKLIDDQTAGLTALRTKVAGETTAAAIKTDAQSMVNDFRVFILTGPKVRLTAAIDTELAVVDKLDDRSGVDQAKLETVTKAVNGQVDKLLAIQPGPDGDAIRAQVQPIREATRSARATLRSLK